MTALLPARRSHSPPTPSSPLSGDDHNADGPSAAKRAKPNPVTRITHSLPYDRGLHLAPMVRIGTLPTRLLSLEYGASLVWGPEIVDKAMLGSTRSVDPNTGVVSFYKLNDDGTQKPAIWTTHPIEKERLIFQIGSASPELALEAARLVVDDVAGIGLNCGCPKPFSTTGGMGARLLEEPERLCAVRPALLFPNVSRLTTDEQILTSLCTLPVPIDCKIRLLPSQPLTLSLVSQILLTPISCLTVHCRTPSMRSSEPALLHRLREIVDLVDGRVPVVANGDCWKEEDYARICELTGVSSIMVARGAEANMSCFRKGKEGDMIKEVLPLYLRVAKATENGFQNSKYVLGASTISGYSKKEKGAFKQGLNQAKGYEEAGRVVGITEYGQEKVEGLLPNWVERRKAILREKEAVQNQVLN